MDRTHYNPSISAVAIEEGLMQGNLESDYLLFINGKAVGVLEAKRAEVDASSQIVAEQAERYARSVPSWCQTWQNPLPLAYLSNGKEFLFRDLRKPDSQYVPLQSVHTPKQIVKMLNITDYYAALPTLQKDGLRDCQYQAISELEKSFRTGQDRALIVLATGAGKTYTACMACYRFLSYTPMKRILFLVDRNNLGKQANDEFGKFRLTETGDAFNTIFGVERLRSSHIPADANVVISTIQRLFAFLSGTPIDDGDGDDDAPSEEDAEVTLPPNPLLPPDYFDAIVIDECHRSIYGNWRQVLTYFSQAKLIGLTATPGPETRAFFNNNVVVNYTLEKSIVDGVNVDYRIYRIRTRETENGGAIREGQHVKEVTCYTGKVEQIRQQETRNYTREELNRSIVNPAQIKLILETYRDAVYTEMFTDPQREANMNYLPKTLIFALSEAHANNIVRIAREVFGRDDDRFVQKITCTAGNTDQLIRQFRNDKDFRIAVTVTLVATGTDVKPLEVVMFMRDVQSEQLYTQMLGRGCRTIGDDQLREVTPNAIHKDNYFVVDAVGVTEHAKTIDGPTDEPTNPTLTLKQLLEKITHGDVRDDYLRALAGRLSRIYNRSDDHRRQEFVRLAGEGMNVLATHIYQALESLTLPPYVDVNQPNNERKGLVAPLTLHPQAREYLLTLAAGFVEILQPGEDELISRGFSVEDARRTTEAFEQYVREHRDENEALRIIYNNEGEPITYAMLQGLAEKLRQANAKFRLALLWNNYAILAPDRVERNTTKAQAEALTNLIQLVRYAYHSIDRLTSLSTNARRYFNLWCGQAQRNLTDKQREVITQIVDYIVSNGSCDIADIRLYNSDYSINLIRSFGSYDSANEALLSLSRFLLYPTKVA